MSEAFTIVSYVALGIAAICFIAAIFLWFRLHVWQAIGDLTGRTRRTDSSEEVPSTALGRAELVAKQRHEASQAFKEVERNLEKTAPAPAAEKHATILLTDANGYRPTVLLKNGATEKVNTVKTVPLASSNREQQARKATASLHTSRK